MNSTKNGHASGLNSCAIPSRTPVGAIFYILRLSIFLGLTGAFCSVGLAQSTKDEGEEFAQAVETRAKLDTEIRVLRAERRILEDDERSSNQLLQDLKGMEKGELRDQLVRILDSYFRQVPAEISQMIGDVVGDSTARVEKLKQDLAQTRNSLIAERTHLLEDGAHLEFSGQLASTLNVDNKWLWLSSVIAVTTILLMIAHNNRHALRRLMWVRRTQGIVLVVIGVIAITIPLLPTVLTFALGNKTYQAILELTSQDRSAELNLNHAEQLKSLQSEIAQKQTEYQQLVGDRKELIAKRRQQLGDVFSENSHATFAEDWVKMRDQIVRAHLSLEIPKALAEEIKKDVAKLNEFASKSSKVKEKREGSSQMKHQVAAGLGAVLCLAVGGVAFYFQMAINRRRRHIAETCPRCLSVGKLIKDSNSDVAIEGVAADLSSVRCQSVLSNDPYEECGFTYRSQYRERIKLSFPTLGIAASGKTHWLAMAYRELKLTKPPEGVHFEKIQSSGSEKLDSLVNDILHNRISLTATQIGLPEPVNFGVRDRDPLSFGGTDLVLNMFDFAGTVTVSGSIHDSIRIRQLNSEGFLFFLDPTKSSEKQIEALTKFREEVRLVKQAGTGQKLHTPVAICVSKIDRTVYQDYSIDSDAMQTFFQDLGRIDAETVPMSLVRIERRSKLVGDLRDMIWPNWAIEEQIRGLFGDRFMFFPMTPVSLPPPGINDRNIIDDLKRRTIAPYGILEPVLWLLHMNGYPVLRT